MVYPHSYRTEHSETKTSNSIYGEYYANAQGHKIPIQPDLLKILQFVDSHRDEFVDDVAKAVKIKSISGNLKFRSEVQKMIKFTEDWLIKLGLKHECFNIGCHKLEGKEVSLPAVILASLGKDPKKKTLVVYAHLDVKEPDAEKWVTDPWAVTLLDNHYYGNGVISGKGTLITWFHIIQAFQAANLDLPVNLKFVIESMYHHKSTGLAEFLALRRHDFFCNIDNIIVCDSEWIGEKMPCIIYGVVGFIHYDLTIEKTPESPTDPRDDMVKIFNEICDDQGKILIPHFFDFVKQITPEEEVLYESITDFDIDEARKSLPLFKQDWDQIKLLMSYWRLPSIWVGDTEECNCANKTTDVVKRHFIIKIVPRQIIQRSSGLSIKHVENLVKDLKIQNKVNCEMVSATRYWHESVEAPHYKAARRATIQIYKEDPNMIREDRDRLVITILDRVLEKSILLLPLASRGSNVGGDNENIHKRNFFEGAKLLAAYMFQFASI